MNRQSLQSRLSSAWEEANTSWCAELNRPLVRVAFAAIGGRLADGASVLDLGCGDGHMARVFARAGLRPYAIDVDHRAARAAALRYSQRRTFVCALAERLPVRAETFDVVYAGSVFQYTDREAVLAECARVLRPGGLLVAIENLRGHPVARAARVWLRLARRYRPHLTPREHLRRRDVGIYLRHFASAEATVFNLTTPLAYALGGVPPSAYGRLHRADRWCLDRLPLLEHLAWHVVICAIR